MYRDTRHSGIYSDSLFGEVGNQVKVGVWGPRRLMSYTDWYVAEEVGEGLLKRLSF